MANTYRYIPGPNARPRALRNPVTGGYAVLKPGVILPETHPLVERFPDEFELVHETVQEIVPDVETATRAPGERRRGRQRKSQ